MSMYIIKKEAQTQVALQQRQPLKKDGASPLFSKSNCHVERTLMRNCNNLCYLLFYPH